MKEIKLKLAYLCLRNIISKKYALTFPWYLQKYRLQTSMNSEELVVDSNLEGEIHAMEPHGITFELQMPEGMDTSEVSEVLELLEVLQNDIREFDH